MAFLSFQLAAKADQTYLVNLNYRSSFVMVLLSISQAVTCWRIPFCRLCQNLCSFIQQVRLLGQFSTNIRLFDYQLVV